MTECFPTAPLWLYFHPQHTYSLSMAATITFQHEGNSSNVDLELHWGTSASYTISLVQVTRYSFQRESFISIISEMSHIMSNPEKKLILGNAISAEKSGPGSL